MILESKYQLHLKEKGNGVEQPKIQIKMGEVFFDKKMVLMKIGDKDI